MRIPRDLSGLELIKLLHKYGYNISKQRGSHIKITTQENGEHHLAIPNHNPLKIGTLNGIITKVSNHFSLTKNQVLENLFN
ncbi:MAG: type II toxin-antitoxin system HicA family toxin [Saprospiraceae bacterium]